MMSSIDTINVNVTWQNEDFQPKEPQIYDVDNMLKIFVRPIRKT